MKYYKNELNKIFAFEDNFSGVPEKLISVTESEAMLIVNPPLTEAELLEQAKASMESAIQSLLDTTARANGGWDNMMSARASAKPVLDTDSAEALAMKTNANALEDWYFKTWGKSYQVQADVEAGTIPMPTVDELIAMLPIFGV